MFLRSTRSKVSNSFNFCKTFRIFYVNIHIFQHHRCISIYVATLFSLGSRYKNCCNNFLGFRVFFILEKNIKLRLSLKFALIKCICCDKKDTINQSFLHYDLVRFLHKTNKIIYAFRYVTDRFRIILEHKKEELGKIT